MGDGLKKRGWKVDEVAEPAALVMDSVDVSDGKGERDALIVLVFTGISFVTCLFSSFTVIEMGIMDAIIPVVEVIPIPLRLKSSPSQISLFGVPFT